MEFVDSLDPGFEPEITWEELREISTLLAEAADELEALVRSSLSQPEKEKNDDEENTSARSHQHDDSGTAANEREK
jgi:hypothetical protein